MQDFQSILQNRQYFGLFEYLQKAIQNESIDSEDQDQRSFTLVEDLNIILIGWESVRHCTGQKLNISGLAKEILSDRVKQLINKRRTFESVKSRIKDYLVKLNVSDILNIALIYRDKLLPTASEPKSYPGLFGYYCCNLLINKERKMFEIEYGMKNKNKLNRRRFIFQIFQPTEIKDSIGQIMSDPFHEGNNNNNQRDDEEYDRRDGNSNHQTQEEVIIERKQQKYQELKQVQQQQDLEEQGNTDESEELKLEAFKYQKIKKNNANNLQMKQQQQQVRQESKQQQQQEQSFGQMDNNDIPDQQVSSLSNQPKTLQYPEPNKFKQFLANANTIKRRTLNYSDYLGNSKQSQGNSNDQGSGDYREDQDDNNGIQKLPVMKSTSESVNVNDSNIIEDNQFQRSRFQIFKKPTNTAFNRFIKGKQFLEEEPEEEQQGNQDNQNNNNLIEDDDIENIPDIEKEYEQQQRYQQQQQYLKQQQKQYQKQLFQNQFQTYETNELSNYPRKFIKTELEAMKYPIQNNSSIARMTINKAFNLNPIDLKNNNLSNTISFANSDAPSSQQYVESEQSQISNNTNNQQILTMADNNNLSKDASVIEESHNEIADDASFYYEQHVQLQKQSQQQLQQQQNSQKQSQQFNDNQEKPNINEVDEEEYDDEEEFKQLIHLREWLGSMQGYYYSQMSQSQGGYYNNRYLCKDERSLRLLSNQRNSTSQFDRIWMQIQQEANEQLEQEQQSESPPQIYYYDDSDIIESSQSQNKLSSPARNLSQKKQI